MSSFLNIERNQLNSINYFQDSRLTHWTLTYGLKIKITLYQKCLTSIDENFDELDECTL